MPYECFVHSCTNCIRLLHVLSVKNWFAHFVPEQNCQGLTPIEERVYNTFVTHRTVVSDTAVIRMASTPYKETNVPVYSVHSGIELNARPRRVEIPGDE